MASRNLIVALICTGLFAPSVSTAGPKKKKQAAQEMIDAAATVNVRKADRQEDLDYNNDGVVDLVTYYTNHSGQEQLFRREADLNLDGRVDVVTDYDEAGLVAKESFDGDFDGRFDWIDFYENGVRVRAETDTDYNGSADFFSYYTAGKPTKKGRDIDGDGEIDFWERFDENGEVLAKGGEFDIREKEETSEPSEDEESTEK